MYSCTEIVLQIFYQPGPMKKRMSTKLGQTWI